MIELTLEEAQHILSALRIGKISFERDEGLRVWDGTREKQVPVETKSYPTINLFHTVVTGESLLTKKVKNEIENVYRGPIDRIEAMGMDF